MRGAKRCECEEKTRADLKTREKRSGDLREQKKKSAAKKYHNQGEIDIQTRTYSRPSVGRPTKVKMIVFGVYARSNLNEAWLKPFLCTNKRSNHGFECLMLFNTRYAFLIRLNSPFGCKQKQRLCLEKCRSLTLPRQSRLCSLFSLCSCLHSLPRLFFSLLPRLSTMRASTLLLLLGLLALLGASAVLAQDDAPAATDAPAADSIPTETVTGQRKQQIAGRARMSAAFCLHAVADASCRWHDAYGLS